MQCAKRDSTYNFKKQHTRTLLYALALGSVVVGADNRDRFPISTARPDAMLCDYNIYTLRYGIPHNSTFLVSVGKTVAMFVLYKVCFSLPIERERERSVVTPGQTKFTNTKPHYQLRINPLFIK